jgi:aconitase A
MAAHSRNPDKNILQVCPIFDAFRPTLDVQRCLTEEAGHRTRGFGVSPVEVGDRRDVSSRGGEMVSLGHGSVVFASIAAYTNASYPSVLLASGLLAKNAFDKGLKLPSHMETCLKPGSGMVDFYRGEVVPSLESLGFKVDSMIRRTMNGLESHLGHSNSLWPSGSSPPAGLSVCGG